MNKTAKYRRIYLCCIAAASAFFEVFAGAVNILDRSSFLNGLPAMLLGIFVIPTLLGLLWGVYEALGVFSAKALGLSIIRLLAVLIGHTLIGATVFCYTLSSRGDLAETLSYFSIWSLGLGAVGFAISYLLTCAVKRFGKPMLIPIAIAVILLIIYVITRF